MKKIKFLIIILCVAIIGVGCSKETDVVSANKEEVEPIQTVKIPLDFKGVKLGQTPTEVKNIFKGLQNSFSHEDIFIFSCYEKYKDSNPLESCSNVENLTIASHIPDSALFIFSKKSNLLTAIQIYLDEKYFDEVVEAMTKKYGNPQISREEPLTNKLTGAESKNYNLMWLDSHNNGAINLTNHDKDGSTYTPQTSFVMRVLVSDEKEKSTKNDI